MKTNAEIAELATRSSLVSNPKVAFLAEGFGNENYLLEEDGKRFVLRLKKSTETQFLDSLEKENSFLKYFEHEGLDFCPKALFYDRDKNFLIENFIEGELVSQRDFSDGQIDLFAKQMYELFHLDIPTFGSFCKKNNLKQYEYINPIESLKLYGFNRFEEAKKGNLPEEIIEWTEKTLEENLKYLEGLDDDENSLGFAWGDIQSKLIIDTDGRMNFYDFEHACVSNSFGLSYIKIHGSFSEQQLSFLIDRCAHYFKLNREQLIADMNANEKIVRTNDVVWAAMKWAITSEKAFEDLTYRRIDLVKNI